MKYQAKAHWCGPASIQNAVVLLGHKLVSQKKIAELCGTTDDGTDEFGMMRGLRLLGYTFKEHWFEDANKLKTNDNSVWLLCVDNWTHWVVVMSFRDLWLVVDPERTKKNKAENGVHLLRWEQLKRRWGCAFKAAAREAGDPAYYALEIIR